MSRSVDAVTDWLLSGLGKQAYVLTSRARAPAPIAVSEEAAAVYREMVHDEGRSGYGWWLAAALRGLSDVLLRRRRWSDASAAAEEAIAHYEPILAAGDGRVATMLAFAPRRSFTFLDSSLMKGCSRNSRPS